jgi:iron complex outermembrane recepter protein
MKLDKLFQSLLLTGAVVVLINYPAKGEDVQESSKNIPQLNEIEHFSKSASVLVQVPKPNSAPLQEVVSITSVKANPTDKGVEVILQTSKGEQLQVTNRSTGNNFIADITGGQLRLADGGSFIFRSQKPITGITEITVTNFDADTVRVTVIGEKALPTVELFDDDAGLIFGVVAAATATQPAQQPEAQQKPESETPQEKPPQKPVAQQDEPIELVVTGQQDGYRVPDGTTATKTDTPLRDIPQSIQVVPRQVIEDRNTPRVGEALRNVSGVQQPANTSAGLFDQVFIRGFSAATDAILRNGSRDQSNGFIPYDTANLEQIEVLKGPGSVLYGQGQPGGTVNLVTKQPLQEPFYRVSATVGNYDSYRGTVDLTGPLNASKTLLYRLNAAVQTSGSFIDELSSSRYFVSPVLTWQISPNTKLTFDAEYLQGIVKTNFGLPAVGTVLPNRNGKLQRGSLVNEPYEDNRRAFRLGYNFEHQFSENWQIQNAFRANLIDGFGAFSSGFSPNLLADQRTLTREYTEVPGGKGSHRGVYTLDTYVVGKFNTGGIQHQLVAGVDIYRNALFANPSLNRVIAPLDIFNPVFGAAPGRVLSRNPATSTTIDNLGIYIQDQIKLAENLKLLLGGRFDIVSRKFENSENASANSFQQDEAFSPRVGLVYQPIKPISLYASYSRSFNQVIGTTFDSTLFEPEEGTQYEVGVKADLSNRVAATLAFYDLTRSNVLTLDPRNTRFSIQTGKQRSRGIEFDVAGEILPGWNVIASYAYTDATVTTDNRFAVGNRLPNIPLHSASLWTTYTLQKGSLQGLGFGLGLYHAGERKGDLANTFELPGYLRTDAALFYKRDKLRVGLNIENLFGSEYFESASSPLRVYYGAPFTIRGSISLEF